ncbi:MAG: CRISPR-associated endonuclease Cas1 [Anaerolineae bacterium]|nr:CRISPR-associated endonuclease Cas1 [Anaerolineae bacterium]
MIVEYLIADTFGTHIGKYSKRLKITQGGKALSEAPLLHLRAVYIIERGVSISADAVAICCEQGIPIHYMDSLGRNYATLYSSGLTGTVLTRRAQLEAYHDERAFAFAQAITLAKLHNQATTLKYLAKNRRESQPDVYEELRLCASDVLDCTAQIEAIQLQCVDAVRDTIMGIEGNAGRIYWSAVRAVIPTDYNWQTRHGRGATDAVNSLLNYGYGILYSRIEQAVTLAGLDPYAAFLHADRPGKPSLVLDLIEEFRQVAVDRVIWGLVNRNFTVVQSADGKLSEETRRIFANKILDHQHATFRYEGKKVSLRIIIQTQARKLASFLRGDCDAYQGFKATY